MLRLALTDVGLVAIGSLRELSTVVVRASEEDATT
jgi:hypothetical protein